MSRMRQGAVGHVEVIEHHGRCVIEKHLTDPDRRTTEMLALRALADQPIPVPELIETRPDSLVMSLMPGERLDSLDADAWLEGLRNSAGLLRQLHELPAPDGLPTAPDDARIVRRYRDAGGPPLPLTIPPTDRLAFCHGDWTDANLLALDGEITAVLDWERAHLGDPVRDVSRAVWGASRKDPQALDALLSAYGPDRDRIYAWLPIHAAELWLWFAEAGPSQYYRQLTTDLTNWPLY